MSRRNRLPDGPGEPPRWVLPVLVLLGALAVVALVAGLLLGGGAGAGR